MKCQALRLWIGILAAAAPLPALGQFDSVVAKRGTPNYGDITEITRDQIAIDTKQGKKLFPVNEIQKVSFKGEPRELSNARGSIRKGQLEAARSDLEKISADGISRQEILTDIEFYKAFCDGRLALVGGGDKGAAVRALLAFEANSANRNNYHHYAAMELLGDLAVALSIHDKAIEYYGRLGEAPWPNYQMRAAVLQANAMVSNKQFDDAGKKFDEVIATTRDDIEARSQKQLAILGKAICQAETGKPEEGIASIETIIAENDSREKPQLFARAYNALGTCYQAADKSQDALLAYLHVDLMFNQDPDAHAEALFRLSRLWTEVNKSERGLRARTLLESRYSGSRWANQK